MKLSRTDVANTKYLLLCCAVSALLCIAQISDNTLLIVACLCCFLALAARSYFKKMALPVMLFFLPWSPLLKVENGTMSMFTVALLMVTFLAFVYHRARILIPSIILFGLTLISKLLGGYAFDNTYILVMALLFFFPALAGEIDRYDFFTLTLFFVVGIVSAALSAQQLVVFPGIAEFIDVYVFERVSVTRLSGYYGDSNFYSAHITAAMSGVLLMILQEKRRGRLFFLIISAVILLYCGLLSGSKSFVLVIIGVLVLWVGKILFSRGKATSKVMMILSVAVIAVFVMSSTLFADLIDMIIVRFGPNSDATSFTSGRAEIWMNYLNVFVEDFKILMMGAGISPAYVEGRASHNTIIQIVFQIGLLGIPFLIAWVMVFVKKCFRFSSYRKTDFMSIVILLFGVFAPWISVDMLLFNEFFLMQFFVCSGIFRLEQKTSGDSSVKTGLGR